MPVAALGQEYVVDARVDAGDLVREVALDVGEVTPNGGDLVGEVAPSHFHETPHPQEATDDRGYRCYGVWSHHADSVAALGRS